MTKIDLVKICGIAKKAGNEILNIYHNPALSGNVVQKIDDSPLTLADKASNQVIMEALKSLYPHIPIISEEEARTMKPDYFLVLPYHFLDEMMVREKEFIERGGKFIVPVPTVKLLP